MWSKVAWTFKLRPFGHLDSSVPHDGKWETHNCRLIDYYHHSRCVTVRKAGQRAWLSSVTSDPWPTGGRRPDFQKSRSLDVNIESSVRQRFGRNLSTESDDVAATSTSSSSRYSTPTTAASTAGWSSDMISYWIWKYRASHLVVGWVGLTLILCVFHCLLGNNLAEVVGLVC